MRVAGWDLLPDITIVAQHVCDLFTTAAERPSQRRDWNASAVWNQEFLEYEFRDIFSQDVCQLILLVIELIHDIKTTLTHLIKMGNRFFN